jgi:hypothetical protein
MQLYTVQIQMLNKKYQLHWTNNDVCEIAFPFAFCLSFFCSETIFSLVVQ